MLCRSAQGCITVACLILVGCGESVQSPPSNQSNALGPNEAFDKEINKVGQLSTQEFAKEYAPDAKYLSKISFDPTKASFWDKFSLDTDDPNAKVKILGTFTEHRDKDGKLLTKRSPKGMMDCRLNEQEMKLFKKNGFVVSERLGAHSFTDVYWRIYVRDLPVFVTSDSMLHAWHKFFDRLLERIEEHHFQPTLTSLLEHMANEIPQAKAAYGNKVLGESLKDVDFFLAVARELLHPGTGKSMFGQQSRVEDAIQACKSLKSTRYQLFGRNRVIDFSQFKPRGRYDNHEWSKRYFQAMMWLGRIDFRIAGTKSTEQELRELGASLVLNDLLERAKGETAWHNFDQMLTHFIGRTDSLNFSQLGSVLSAWNTPGASDINEESLNAVHKKISKGKIGTQQIRGHHFCVDPYDPEKFVLPKSFAFMGQRFVLDSWALSKVVYDDIHWNNEKIQRRIPSSLDVSFAVFGNNHVMPWLTQRMKDTKGKRFRDGLPYQHNLASVRKVIDEMPNEQWQDNMYSHWLGCLRELSKPTTDKKYPEAMRTQAWALKSTTTQLASWTQLRHDTILYAKPSYSAGNTCFYPAGFVEPIPHFWQRFEQMVKHTESLISKNPFPGLKDPKKAQYLKYQYKTVKTSIERFSKAASTLRSISEAQLAQKDLTKEQLKFLREIVVKSNMCGAPPISGWYPKLFLKRSQQKSEDDAHKWVALVTDVHTDPPSPPAGDPGCVLHQAVGNVDLMLITIDNGKDRMVYAGPVFSHYEFETPLNTRLTNAQWQDRLRGNRQPKRADWTKSYLAPGVNPNVKKFGK